MTRRQRRVVRLHRAALVAWRAHVGLSWFHNKPLGIRLAILEDKQDLLSGPGRTMGITYWHWN